MYKTSLQELKLTRISQITKELITADLSKQDSWKEITFLTDDLKRLSLQKIPDLEAELSKKGLSPEQQFQALNETEY
jgi:hypothetical protein